MMRRMMIGTCLALLIPTLYPALASGQGCGLEATPIPGLGLGPGGAPPRITAIAESPGGDVIYVGGTGLYDAGGAALPSVVALRDGAAEGVGDLQGTPRLLGFNDIGVGPELYAAGSFQFDGVQSGVVRWDGAKWRHMGDGLQGSRTGFSGATSLLVFDDGSGPAVYAGGDFTSSGTTELNGVARWRGSAWEPLGAGFEGTVYTLTAMEIDGESRLVAGGNTGHTSAHPAILHSWNGHQWDPLAGVLTGHVAALTHRDTAAGPELAAMGWMRTPELTWGWLLTAFDGTQWRPLGIELVERATFGFDIAVPPGIFEAFPWRQSDALIIGTAYMKMELYSGALINHVTIFNSAGWCDPHADGVILASARSSDGSFLIGGALTSFGGVDFVGPARLRVDFCYADCDGSGELDFFDFLCFQNLFAAGDPEADCDGSGALDFFDFLCFQDAFAAGCP